MLAGKFLQRIGVGAHRAGQVAAAGLPGANGCVAVPKAEQRLPQLWFAGAGVIEVGEVQRHGQIERIAHPFAAFPPFVQQASRRPEHPTRRGGGFKAGDQAVGGGFGAVAKAVLLQGGLVKCVEFPLFRFDRGVEFLTRRVGFAPVVHLGHPAQHGGETVIHVVQAVDLILHVLRRLQGTAQGGVGVGGIGEGFLRPFFGQHQQQRLGSGGGGVILRHQSQQSLGLTILRGFFIRRIRCGVEEALQPAFWKVKSMNQFAHSVRADRAFALFNVGKECLSGRLRFGAAATRVHFGDAVGDIVQLPTARRAGMHHSPSKLFQQGLCNFRQDSLNLCKSRHFRFLDLTPGKPHLSRVMTRP